MVVGGVIPGVAAANEGRRVTIVGGADATGHRYTWTVTNEDTSPIVYVEFPHYRANLFFSPHGWSTDESTFLVNVGATASYTDRSIYVPKALPSSGLK